MLQRIFARVFSIQRTRHSGSVVAIGRRQSRPNRCMMFAFAACLAWAVVSPVRQVAAEEPGAADLTVELIDGAIVRAVEALHRFPYPVGVDRDRRYWNYNKRYLSENVMGNNALATWAMLRAGESYQDPRLYRRINWVLSRDKAATYDRGMRLNMLSELPQDRWGPWVRRDAFWMKAAVTDKGNFSDAWAGGKATGFGDNANGQYGVLGLWAADRSGVDIGGRAMWERIDSYWREAQFQTPGDKAAGWSIYHSKQALDGLTRVGAMNGRVSGPMTAGGVATLCLTERYLYGPRMAALPSDNRTNVSAHLQKGLAWLDDNFNPVDSDEAADRYYYYWTMQRVGHATGYRSFNGVDLFRDITAKLLNEQNTNGMWEHTQGPLISTGFALLYLSKAYDPAGIGKIRFTKTDEDGELIRYAWNNRPHDIWNFSDFVSDEYEFTTTWQIVELDMPLYSLIETPVLYLATHEDFQLSDVEVAHLKAYIEAGGMLVVNPDRSAASIRRSVEALCETMFPQWKLEKAPDDFGVFDIHQPLGKRAPMQIVHNGVRPLVVFLQKDISEDLQKNDTVRGEGFRILSNLYLFATGMNPQRERLKNNYTFPPANYPTRVVRGARIKHSGNYDPEPGALSQLRNLLGRTHDVDLQLPASAIAASELTPDIDIAFMTTLDAGTLTDQEATAIRQWVDQGGTLWLDAAGGLTGAQNGARNLLDQIAPGEPGVPLSMSNPVINGVNMLSGFDNRRIRFRHFALKSMGPTNVNKLLGIRVNRPDGDGTRMGVIYSTEDLTCGLAGLDHWGIFGYTPTYSRRLVINGVLAVAEGLN